MKTVQEMRARYADQVMLNRVQIADLADIMVGKWKAAIEQRLDVVFEFVSPVDHVTVYSKAVDVTASSEVVMAALSIVVAYFNSLGFKVCSCSSPVYAADAYRDIGVRVSWVTTDDDE